MVAGTKVEQAFDAAIFDMDGLLLDSERVIMRAWMGAAREIGVALSSDAFLQVIGLAIDESNAILEAALGGPEQFAAVRAVAVERLHHGKVPVDYPAKDGAGRLVAQMLNRQIRCAVASSTQADEVRRRLHAVSLLDQFDNICGGDEVDRGKPDPAVYLLAAQRLGVAPTRCLAFEDSDNGIRAALAAGMRVVIVPDLKEPDPALAARAEHVSVSLTACGPLLDQWFGPVLNT